MDSPVKRKYVKKNFTRKTQEPDYYKNYMKVYMKQTKLCECGKSITIGRFKKHQTTELHFKTLKAKKEKEEREQKDEELQKLKEENQKLKKKQQELLNVEFIELS